MIQRLDLTNEIIGRYRLQERLGEGGMAVIYKALDTQSNETVAIKLLRPFLVDSARALKRFEREARTLARLSHPNIVRVLGFGDHEGWPYLVMEYVPGGTLKGKIGQPLPWQTAAHLLLPVAQALAYAHEQGITHRDVKPANILLDEHGMPKLSDFGIAKLTAGEETTFDLTGTGMGIGTPDYMAPEQFTGSADPRVDIYAFGVLFYELITGNKPFTSATPGGVILKKTTENPTLPSSAARHIPKEIETFLFRLLHRDPDSRFQSMTEVLTILQSLATGKLTGPALQRQPSYRWKWAITGFAGVTTVAVLAWMFGLRGLATQTSPSPDSAKEVTRTTATNLPPTSFPRATVTVQPSATIVPFLFQDEFTDFASGWDRGQNEEFLTDYQDGGYRIWINSPEKIAWGTPGLNFKDDVRLEVYATKRSGPDNNGFGLLCRYTKPASGFSFYFFYISSEGIAAIGKYVNGELTYLGRSESAIPEINQGAATNRINADCVGENLVLYVNGTQILAATDSSLTAGDVGVIARTFREVGTDILFDNFTVARP